MAFPPGLTRSFIGFAPNFKTEEEKRSKMSKRNQTSGELMPSSGSSRERMLLRKIADNYYGVYLVRVIEGITHNLSGPLQVLYIRSEQLEQSLEQLRGLVQSEGLAELETLADRMQEKVKSISSSLDNLNHQLRHLANPLIGEKCSDVGDVKINEVIEDCLFLLNANMFFKHNVKKTLSLDDGLPILKGRKTDFCIIILNLAQNALEAMTASQDKHLAIETSSQQDKVIIRIHDTGCGIPEQDREHIYDIFFTTKKGSGNDGKLDEHAGLGLALVSLVLEDYNGTIACESVPGKTTFTIQIPSLVNSSDE
jgi:two-component system C4-dicarboxylate transport sensor histidine kinase DctB